jgi:hypothetical protein
MRPQSSAVPLCLRAEACERLSSVDEALPAMAWHVVNFALSSESKHTLQMMTSGTAGPFEEPGTAKVTQHDVDIGIKWKREPAPAGNDVMEIVIQEIIPGGAADQVISKH